MAGAPPSSCGWASLTDEASLRPMPGVGQTLVRGRPVDRGCGTATRRRDDEPEAEKPMSRYIGLGWTAWGHWWEAQTPEHSGHWRQAASWTHKRTTCSVGLPSAVALHQSRSPLARWRWGMSRDEATGHWPPPALLPAEVVEMADCSQAVDIDANMRGKLAFAKEPYLHPRRAHSLGSGGQRWTRQGPGISPGRRTGSAMSARVTAASDGADSPLTMPRHSR